MIQHTDRELLELAAKSIGLTGRWYEDQQVMVVGQTGSRRKEYWNPINDDGDAFRLAVKLGFCISHWPRNIPPDVMVGYRIKPNDGSNIIELYGDDPAAATRRAIVLAAAEIGKAMP